MQRFWFTILFLALPIITLSSCGMYDDDSDAPHVSYTGSGSLSFDILWRHAAGLFAVDADVYDQDGNLQLRQSWPYREDPPEAIDDVPAGANKKLVITGKDRDGLIICRGESENFNLNNNQTIELDYITADLFRPVSELPINNIHMNGEAITFTWEPMEGAVQYRFRIDQGIQNVVDEIVSETEYRIEHFYDYVTSVDNQTDDIIQPADTLPFPDTGQSDSYTDTPGEDSDYPYPRPPSYTKYYGNGIKFSGGKPVTYTWYASSITTEGEESTHKKSYFKLIWSVVRDDITGLYWEVKTDDGSSSDFTNNSVWDGVDYIADLNNRNFGGISSWRLPNIKELASIINSGNRYIAINDDIFYFCPSSVFWTSTEDAKDANYAWTIDFSGGTINWIYKEWLTIDEAPRLKIRAVSGPLRITENRFTDNGDGTLIDAESNMMWTKDNTGANLNWEESLAWIQTKNSEKYLGYDDWRMPNKNELLSIVNYNAYNPAAYPEFNTQSSYYWTSTTVVYPTGYDWNAWTIDFNSGKTFSTLKTPAEEDETPYLRAVRNVTD